LVFLNPQPFVFPSLAISRNFVNTLDTNSHDETFAKNQRKAELEGGSLSFFHPQIRRIPQNFREQLVVMSNQ